MDRKSTNSDWHSLSGYLYYKTGNGESVFSFCAYFNNQSVNQSIDLYCSTKNYSDAMGKQS